MEIIEEGSLEKELNVENKTQYEKKTRKKRVNK